MHIALQNNVVNLKKSFFRFFIKIGVPTEVCHVDPTGSLDSHGFKIGAKSPKKNTAKSPKKNTAKSQKNNALKSTKKNVANSSKKEIDETIHISNTKPAKKIPAKSKTKNPPKAEPAELNADQTFKRSGRKRKKTKPDYIDSDEDEIVEISFKRRKRISK